MVDIEITFISYIETMQEAIQLIYNEINKANRIPEIIDHIDKIKSILDSLDSYVMLSIQTANQLLKEYRSISYELFVKRRYMESRLGEKRINNNMQPHIIDTIYDEDKLLSQFNFENPIDANDITNLNIIELTDQKDYSCIGIIKRFESEQMFIQNINQMVTTLFDNLLSFLNKSTKKSVLKLKSNLTDVHFLEEICSDSDDSKKELSWIQTFLLKTRNTLENMKKNIIKTHQLFIALMTNYDIYDEAIDRYTRLTINDFLNKDKPYEIC